LARLSHTDFALRYKPAVKIGFALRHSIALHDLQHWHPMQTWLAIQATWRQRSRR
jgi:hypothetical protein